MTRSSFEEVQLLKARLHSLFGIKDLGLLHYFLGFEVSYVPDGITMTQKKFTNELLMDSGIQDDKSVCTPFPLNCKLAAYNGELLPDATPYRVLLGKLNFLTNTRPDLSYAVRTLSQFMQQPRLPHFNMF